MHKIILDDEQKTRFWAKVKLADEDECWEWQAFSTAAGYGRFRLYDVDGKRIVAFAHRIAYTLYYGAIEDGYFICHACDNPSCCNYRHLWQGTHTDNVRDMVSKNRHALANEDNRKALSLIKLGKKKRTNTSGYVGVHWHKRSQRWYAEITLHKKKYWLGSFNTAEDAKAAYDKALAEYKTEE